MRLASAYLFGVLFGVGLGVSGMTDPAKIQAFLDVAGAWDPRLMLVMGGAVAVSFVAFRVVLARRRPLLAPEFYLPGKRPISFALVGGAALFGTGWGLSGFCPGPALVSLVTGSPAVVVFVSFMGAGLLIGDRLRPEQRERAPVEEPDEVDVIPIAAAR